MQALSFLLSGAGLLVASGIAVMCAWMNGALWLINIFAFKPAPYVYPSYAPVFAACAALEMAWMVKTRHGSVVIPLAPLLWAWHLGVFRSGGG